MTPGSLVMAFGFGTKKIGVAVGQRITGTANPLAILAAKDGIRRWTEVEKLINEWQPVHIVVGLPLNMDNSSSLMSEKAEKFARRLTGRFNIEHTTVDERLSSYEARNHVKANESVDAFAAKLILETYFSQS